MPSEKDNSRDSYWDKYPYNLLAAIRGKSEREIPKKLTDDQMAGLEYILSTLECRERDVLLQRYRDYLPRTEVAEDCGIISERVRQIETKACQKLRRWSKWNYIVYGVAGYVKHIAATEYNRGYSTGYGEGYKDGKTDEAAGVTKAYASDEVLNQPIESLNLSTRAYNCLRLINCKRVGDVVRLTDERISTMRQLGKMSANEIAQAIRAINIQWSAWDKYLL